MIYFDHLPLSEGILQALSLLEIDYVFQPIFYKDGKTVFAREALMRPHGTTVTELINEYTEIGQLHILEVATLFGAMQAHILRGYTDKVCINSFPSECFTPDEGKAYNDYFGDLSGQMIVEILEYPSISVEKLMTKKEHAKNNKNMISVDDFGTGLADNEMLRLTNPQIVKLDRSLISDIDTDEEKQENVKELVKTLHSNNYKIVAEGIETRAEFETLVSYDIEYYQGYYLGRPV